MGVKFTSASQQTAVCSAIPTGRLRYVSQFPQKRWGTALAVLASCLFVWPEHTLKSWRHLRRRREQQLCWLWLNQEIRRAMVCDRGRPGPEPNNCISWGGDAPGLPPGGAGPVRGHARVRRYRVRGLLHIRGSKVRTSWWTRPMRGASKRVRISRQYWNIVLVSYPESA